MANLLSILIYVIGFTLLAVGEVLSLTLGLLLKVANFAYRKAFNRSSERLTAISNGLLMLRSRQAKAAGASITDDPEKDKPLDTISDTPFEIAKIHTRKFKGGSVRVVMYQYQDEIKRSAWIPVREGKKGKVPRRFVMASLQSQSISDAWIATKSDVYDLVDRINAVRNQKDAKVRVDVVSSEPTKVEHKVEPLPVAKAEVQPVQCNINPEPITSKQEAAPQVEALSAKKLDRPVEWIGRILEYGRARREDVAKPYTAYRVKIQSELGVAEDIWGADLARSIEESNVLPGQKVHIRFVGKRPVPVKDDEGNIETREKNIYQVNLLAQ
ncbi:hypothetical protein QU487_07040 [Crenobacter sp. SG2305]|uniref:hypothetical protein n=1 Tax=Crenobacter oryzisoli TaxID=3056844 RepID=UPI0025AA5251|nr:hypothetical protein [Crenobacter sp. SG2305]MDN0082511.1 hypothetical protein [Crenobacter sp. SG2305]